MFRLSLATFREQWQLFLGSIVMVATGVALVQSSLLIVVTVSMSEPAAGLSLLERAQVMNSHLLAIPVVGITLALAVFLTIFIVSSTFAFTVAQRRRDLALLRLTGGSRRQVRRLLLSEATLLGLIGTVCGIPLGVAVMRFETWLLISFDFLPTGFRPEWRHWIYAVSIGIGLGVSLAGVLVASRRAGRVRPLDALRGSSDESRVMTASRWVFGVLFLAVASALTIVALTVDPSGAMPLTMLVALAAAVGLSALSPVVVPVFGRLLGQFGRRRPIWGIAAANVRDGTRRSASTAAPLIMLVGILVGLLGSSLTLTAASEVMLRRDTTADVVVTSTGSDTHRIAQLPGVASVSVEAELPVVMTNIEHEDDSLGGDLAAGQVRVIDPDAYRAVHRLQPESGSLDALHGRAVALGPGHSDEWGYELGDTIDLRIGDRQLHLPIVAVMPTAMYGGAELLLPRGIAPEPVVSSAPTQTFVSTTAASDPATVTDHIRRAVPGTVEGIDAWVEQHAEAAQQAQLRIFAVLLGMACLYALFAAINAVVISAANRRAEFAAARLSGLTRRQVVVMAVLESATVTAIGVLLGGIAAAGTVLGMSGALQRMAGVGGVQLPWLAIVALVVGAFVIIGATSFWTARSATRVNPVSVVSDQ